MKKHTIVLAALVLVVTPSLVGCGQEMSTAPAFGGSHAATISEESAQSGQQMFNDVNAQAMAVLSLSDVVLLTPYITGTKSIDTATLSEIVLITPAVTRFQAAFNAAMSTLSLGDVVKVTSYMSKAGKNHFPYPELAAPGQAGA